MGAGTCSASPFNASGESYAISQFRGVQYLSFYGNCLLGNNVPRALPVGDSHDAPALD